MQRLRVLWNQFQSTRLHEARRHVHLVSSWKGRFNPRAYMRRDKLCDCQRGGIRRFNPRAYMRRDLGRCQIRDCKVFQSTRLHEARRVNGQGDFSMIEFQSTRLHEARRESRENKAG